MANQKAGGGEYHLAIAWCLEGGLDDASGTALVLFAFQALNMSNIYYGN